MSSSIPGSLAAGPDARPQAGPARSGTIPALADCFTVRLQTGPGPLDAHPPGQWLVLTGPAAPARPVYDWPGGTGKTQLAVYLAQTWWQRSQAGLLVWLTAASRDSVPTDGPPVKSSLWMGLHEDGLVGHLPPAQREAVLRARRFLDRWRSLKDRLPIARLLGEVFADSGYDAAMQFEHLGDRKLANLWKLVDLARTFDRSGLFGLAELIARLGHWLLDARTRRRKALHASVGGARILI